jgi:hypothetical protein
MIRKLLKVIFPPFTKLEQTLLEILVDSFSGEAKQILEAQIRGVNVVQRHRESKHVVLFRMRGFHVYRNPKISFPAGEDEVRFATIDFTHDGRRYKAQFWITRGFFSVIDFNTSPVKIADETVLRDVAIKILRDPLSIPAQPPSERVISITDLTGPLKEMLLGCKANKVFSPLRENEREGWLAESAMKLPDDLDQLLARIDGFETQDCEFLGTKRLREIESAGKDFIIVAEHSRKGAMAFQRGDPERGYFLLDYEGGDPVFLSQDYISSAKSFAKTEK